MMRELLRVSMNERQVREACEQWARDRTASNGAMAASVIMLAPGLTAPDISAEVIFTKARAPRKAKEATP